MSNFKFKPSTVLKALLDIINTKSGSGRYLVPFIQGPSGIGKTDIILEMVQIIADGRKVIANCLNPSKDELGFLDFRLGGKDTIEVNGLPTVEDGLTVFTPIGYLPQSGEGVLFFDEFAQATPAMQAYIGQLIREGQLNDYTLPKGWRIVLAGNRSTDRAGANKILTHLRGRVVSIDFEHDVNDWMVWASDKGIDQRILGFIQYMPQYLHDIDSKVDAPQPTPRQYENLSDILKQRNPDYDMMQVYAFGTIGEVATLEFLNFVQLMQDVPNLKDIFAGKEVEIPDGVGLQYATVVAISAMLKECDAKKLAVHFENALKYIETFPTQEYAMFFMRSIAGARPEVKDTAVFSNFMVDHQDLLI